MNDNHPLMVFAKECMLGAYSEAELADAARRAINYALEAKDEPVATLLLQSKQNFERNFGSNRYADWIYADLVELVNTTPPQRKPLTYVELRRIANDCGLGANNVSARTQVTVDSFARAIEAAHGIKEKKI